MSRESMAIESTSAQTDGPDAVAKNCGLYRLGCASAPSVFSRRRSAATKIASAALLLVSAASARRARPAAITSQKTAVDTGVACSPAKPPDAGSNSQMLFTASPMFGISESSRSKNLRASAVNCAETSVVEPPSCLKADSHAAFTSALTPGFAETSRMNGMAVGQPISARIPTALRCASECKL